MTRYQAVSARSNSESDAVQRLSAQLEHRYAKDDIRDIYRIIHDLVDHLTVDPLYDHHYNKHLIIMNTLHRFYAAYPHSYVVIHSYSVYVAERLHEIKQQQKQKEKDNERTSCHCVLL